MADQIIITGDNLAIAANGQPIWPAGSQPPEPPDPTPEPGGNGMTKINSESELRAALAAAAQGQRIIVDPSSPAVTVTSTIGVPITREGFYFDGSGLEIATRIPNWGHLLEFTNGKPGLRLKNLHVVGSYPNRECGDAFRFINAQAGNENAFYNFSIQNIRIEHVAGNGMYFEGAFEGSVDVIETNDVGKTGLVFSSGSSGGSVVCQVTVSNAQLSRCDGWGGEQINGADQVTWISPVFVNNGMGGIHATHGIHLIVNPKLENSGETIVVVDSQTWPGAEIISPQLSGDGQWVRNWVNPHTGPSRYVVQCPPGAVAVTGVTKFRGYGGPATQPGWMAVYKPGSAGTQKTEVQSEGAPADAQYAATKPGMEQA